MPLKAGIARQKQEIDTLLLLFTNYQNDTTGDDRRKVIFSKIWQLVSYSYYKGINSKNRLRMVQLIKEQ